MHTEGKANSFETYHATLSYPHAIASSLIIFIIFIIPPQQETGNLTLLPGFSELAAYATLKTKKPRGTYAQTIHMQRLHTQSNVQLYLEA